MKILVFLQGTILQHRYAAGFPREEVIRQVAEQEESVRDFENYIPIGHAPEKLQRWAAQGAEICYMSALTENKEARGDEIVGHDGLKADAIVLERHEFPKGTIYHREQYQSYQGIVEHIYPLPDVLIEDDCESIGGETEMIYPRLSNGTKKFVRSIVTREFEGIDQLPDDTHQL